ncbi:Cell division protein FtsQ [Pseudidiomarina piscicola]|uniref:Cell division protein FtsQ n=1 Tax=Pseudidiomarina piscicola TaxID=2614830 RepID=A0A6S6WPW9_9GAMM|nr:cell division protein FtsQ/DivIB [Pseudidiomarina piscicola]CAB0150995.1 Cell division protein FtsQ [Pseudidiomarina piscicola]VZT40506.1 Cell division protein FtsQ [Pseudomonas aeruginosa]
MATAERTQSWQFWSGLAFFMLVLVSTCSGIGWLYYTAMDAQEVPLKRLVVQGELDFMTPGEVRETLLGEPLGSFFSADVDKIRTQVEAMPWVAKASVRKEWPDILKIFIVEQQPLAHWNANQRDDALVNQEGQVFYADKSVLDKSLPYLSAPEHAVTEAVKHYRNTSELLGLNGFHVTQVELSERFALEVLLEDGTSLRLGREALLERVQRFIDLYPQLKEHQQAPLDSVDLRYDTGVAVRWRNPDEQQQES